MKTTATTMTTMTKATARRLESDQATRTAIEDDTAITTTTVTLITRTTTLNHRATARTLVQFLPALRPNRQPTTTAKNSPGSPNERRRTREEVDFCLKFGVSVKENKDGKGRKRKCEETVFTFCNASNEVNVSFRSICRPAFDSRLQFPCKYYTWHQ
ncbi:hypothetical protein DFJ73DRAFT_818822 [Zopfochytrium polystomum]|nr:hypothetical protein DFJ73DRAFT_818822 [Zopfochytrium polystomum]